MPLGPFTNIYGMGASPVIVGDLRRARLRPERGVMPSSQSTSGQDGCAGNRAAGGEERSFDARGVARPGRQGSSDRPRLVPADGLRRGQRKQTLVGRGLSFRMKSTPSSAPTRSM